MWEDNNVAQRQNGVALDGSRRDGVALFSRHFSSFLTDLRTPQAKMRVASVLEIRLETMRLTLKFSHNPSHHRPCLGCCELLVWKWCTRTHDSRIAYGGGETTRPQKNVCVAQSGACAALFASFGVYIKRARFAFHNFRANHDLLDAFKSWQIEHRVE